ncbi:hypothetical protein JD844_009853 [Phrynosoma platyrhinos]|uniref:Uncharacterized protein n=1 Tax=Phrynosoma platyrhinos TaxID=52577 RepID=A0ABQ7TFX1_PHRPL|nr:hypothetical protein JD844_009853 [Phrynosoma platyrhinos]
MLPHPTLFVPSDSSVVTRAGFSAGKKDLEKIELSGIPVLKRNIPVKMEQDSETNALVIWVHNISWEDIEVTVSARPFFRLLDGTMIFFWYKWLSSLFGTTVCPGEKKQVNKVTEWNVITYQLGNYGWKLYNITVERKSDRYIAACSTPLHCTWIIDEKGIYQEETPTNRCKFEPPAYNPLS